MEECIQIYLGASELPSLFTLTWTLGFEFTAELRPFEPADEFEEPCLGDLERFRFELLEELEL